MSICALAVFMLSGFSVTARAQFMVVEVDHSYQSHDSSAVVVDSIGEPMPGVTVKLMSPGWKTLIQTVETDWRGKFRFRKSKSRLNYLEITHSGFQIMHVKLEVVHRKVRIPRIRIDIAT